VGAVWPVGVGVFFLPRGAQKSDILRGGGGRYHTV
jgi:hypothetical protein